MWTNFSACYIYFSQLRNQRIFSFSFLQLSVEFCQSSVREYNNSLYPSGTPSLTLCAGILHVSNLLNTKRRVPILSRSNAYCKLQISMFRCNSLRFPSISLQPLYLLNNLRFLTLCHPSSWDYSFIFIPYANMALFW